MKFFDELKSSPEPYTSTRKNSSRRNKLNKTNKSNRSPTPLITLPVSGPSLPKIDDSEPLYK